MTDTIRTVAESAAALIGVSVSVLGAEKGPASMEGAFDEVVSACWVHTCLPGG